MAAAFARQGSPQFDGGLASAWPVIRPGSMPGAEITSYKPTFPVLISSMSGLAIYHSSRRS